jgi:hypothetical protein
MGHVFARLIGYGHVLLPVSAPYTFRWGDDPRSVQLQLRLDSPFIGVRLNEDGSTKAQDSDQPLTDYVDVYEGQYMDAFRIETTMYSVLWPTNFDCSVDGASDGPLFDFLGPDDSLIYVQGPIAADTVPAAKELCAPTQHFVKEGFSGVTPWAEFEYQHEGESWCQRQYRHEAAGLAFLLTSQCRSAQSAELGSAADAVIESFELMSNGG